VKKISALLAVVLVLSGCASVSVVEERENAAMAPRQAPAVLYARPFTVRPDAQFDAAPLASETDARPRVGREVAAGIEARGERWVAPVQVLEPGQAAPGEGLLIEGQLVRTHQGSRGLRLLIGFGLGRSHMDSVVQVYNLAASRDEPWLRFKTTGGSNMEPGLLPGLIVPSPVTVPLAATAVGSAVGSVSIGQKGVTQDAQRTGRTVTAVVHDRLVAQGLLERKAHPKRSGKLVTPVGQLPALEIE
jgi:hypothetical protein